MCNFHLIDQENDVGIDGQIELFDEKRLSTGKIISAQIKTSKSFYDLKKKKCYIPVVKYDTKPDGFMLLLCQLLLNFQAAWTLIQVQNLIYYDKNTWNFTRLGKVQGLSAEELKNILGEGNVLVTSVLYH